MHYPNWKKLIVFFVSLLVCFFAETIYVFSCGPEPDPYDYYTNFYNPNLAAGKGFEPFYYTSLAQYYGVDEPEQAANLREWSTFFSGKSAKVTDKDLLEFIYTYSRPQMTALYTSIDKGTPLQAPDSVSNNTLTRYFISSKDKETLGYLMFAKRCEVYTNITDAWNPPTPDYAAMMRLARNSIQLYNACKDPFIKERFAYQATRMAHFSKSYETAIHYYDSLAAPLPSNSLIHYKALALKAGALLRTGKKAESVYLFSRVFEAAPSQRTLAYLNTGWAEADKKAVLKLCTSNTEKATVAAMYAARAVILNLDGLREVYRFDPTASILDVLLAREVNKLEDGYLQNAINIDANKINYWYTENSLKADAVKAMQQLTDSIAGQGKVKEPALWQITSAYLSFMTKDYAGAHTRLAAAKPNIQRADLQDQWEIVQLLVNINEQPRIDKAYESKLLASFKWLDSKLPKGKENSSYWDYPDDNSWVNASFYTRMYRNLLDYIIAPRYARQQDTVRLSLILTKRDEVDPTYFRWNGTSGKDFIADSMSTTQLLSLSGLYKSKNKTPFEKYLCDQLPLTEQQLGEVIAINYVRQHDFPNAVTWFKRSGSTRRSELVFEEQLQDFGYEEQDSIRHGISQLEYATRMVELEKKMQAAKVAPEVYFEYATGLFSISYYGHSYQFSVSYRPSTWWYEPAHETSPFLREYFGCYRAEEYYKKAADAATDPEFKAKALYMAARCAQKHAQLSGKEEWWYPATYKNPYFPTLVKEYRHTAFYESIAAECTYLQDFVKKQP
ncbi:PA2169 family four-helix-bundle protein [Chitinophaga sp. GbtcB8]|uniref:PA2169 family four-helix-bundle protein n=1 Tax=Chitinophaga sp. GbtcB8 TaxID=2824753 RepID=UPI001C2FC0BC|nr:PA2169 family four-helix-bundle protein [Chitinophaga sp. GbtcB8]